MNKRWLNGEVVEVDAKRKCGLINSIDPLPGGIQTTGVYFSFRAQQRCRLAGGELVEFVLSPSSGDRPEASDVRKKRSEQNTPTKGGVKSSMHHDQRRVDFKTRLKGVIVYLNTDKEFGFVKPLEEMPPGYPDKNVYFKSNYIDGGVMAVRINDILEFSLGVRDKDKPMAMSAKVIKFAARHPQDINEMIDIVITKCVDGNDRIILSKFMACDALWLCLGEYEDMPVETALLLIKFLLKLHDKTKDIEQGFQTILHVLCHTPFLDPWSGTMKSVIMHSNDMEPVKDFLLLIVKYVPEKLTAVTILIKPLIATEKSSVELFLFKLLKKASSSINARVEDQPWENLSLVPDGRELTDDVLQSTRSLQPVREQGPYDSVEQYMDVYFRLLRADCFGSLKTGIKDFLNGELDPRDLNVFQSVRLVGLADQDSGLALALFIKPLQPVKNWASSSSLMFGNLLCLSVSGNFSDPIWATVVHRDVKLLQTKGIVMIELCNESNSLPQSEAIVKLKQGNDRIIAVESPTYYRAYQPVLQAMQKMDIENFPFQQQIIKCDRTQVNRPPYNSVHNAVVLDNLGSNELCTSLDDSQYSAVCQVFQEKVAVIQGPPGTGKTFIGIKIIELILSLPTVPAGPILILTYKNHALDEFLKGLIMKFPNKIARIGGRCNEPCLEECNLSALRKTKKIPELFKLFIEAKTQVDDAKSAMQKAVAELDNASQYSIDTLLKYSNPTQIVTLLLNCHIRDLKKDEISKLIETMNDKEPHSTINSFLLTGAKSKNNEDLHKILLNCLRIAMKQWYPNAEIENQVQQELGVCSTVNLVSLGEHGKRQNQDVELFDDKDIDDMEKERLAATNVTNVKLDKIQMFHNKTSQPCLFSEALSVTKNIPIASLMNCSNLWDLSLTDRIKFVQCLLLKQFEEPKENFETTLVRYQQMCNRKNDISLQHDLNLLETKKIIGLTMVGASIHKNLLAGIRPSIVIVEEAAEVLEPQLIAALHESVQHLILIGDHKQLRPPVETYELAQKLHLDVSMMERLINNKFPFSTLCLQNRMRPEFSKLLLDIYPGLQDNTERVSKNKPAECLDKSMYFWDHSDPESGGRSYWNDAEADRAVRLCMFLLQNGYEPKQITILGAYQGQTALIRTKMREHEQNYPDLFLFNDKHDEGEESEQQRVEIHTIDMYQGDENDIVIVSLVRSNGSRRIGFLKLLNRRCVVQSRSKCGLYFIGNSHTLCSSIHWSKLVKDMSAADCFGNSITLVCPRHRMTTVKATTAADITLGSFCTVVCKATMKCGKHICAMYCQPTHSHEFCRVVVVFRYENCAHLGRKPCSKPESEMTCKETCGKYMACKQHICEQECGSPHMHNYCAEIIEQTLPCGHSITKQCSASQVDILCKAEVKVKHPVCGHLVSKQCHRDISDVKCKTQCLKTLTCGHRCQNHCGAICTQTESCKDCIKIKEQQARKREEEEQRIIKEHRDKLKDEIKKITAQPTSYTTLSAEGDDASEYYQVEDRVKRYVLPMHRWFPEVKRIEKVQNPTLYKSWLQSAVDLADPRNTVLLFHGTSEEAADKIVTKGFRIPDKAGMFGRGIYFATDSSKSARDIYTKGSNLLLLCDVHLGKCKTVDQHNSNYTGYMLNQLGYDSIYAMRGTKESGGVLNDEYVVFNPAQAFVKYVIHYQRVEFPDNIIGVVATPKIFEKHELIARRGRQIQDDYDTHFRLAESQFLRLTNERRLLYQLTQVDYYVNPPLLVQFEAKAAEFKRKYSKAEEYEYVMAFHGTSPNNINKIVKENFRLDKLSAGSGDRGWYGAGIYFSEFPDISIGYGTQILLCMILSGRCYDCQAKDRQRLEGKPCQAGYDSHRVARDDKGRGQELVIFNSDQILPCYVIHFK